MAAGYSGKSLVQKLGIKSGMRMVVRNAPENYWELLEGLPENVSVADPHDGPVNLIHLFVKERAGLEAVLGELRQRIAPNGMIWVSWPKEASMIPSGLDENKVRELALGAGLVDTKVCAVDETWSGLRLVIRLRDR